MRRVLHFVGACMLLAGCQSQNPYAAFGPPTIPAPSTTQTPPYYPPSGGAASANEKGPATSDRPSVSVRGPSPPAARSAVIPEAADQEPIRILEDSAAAARTAAASRAKAPPPRQSTPAIQPPRAAPPAAPPKTGYLPGGKTLREAAVAPATFVEAPPAAGQWRAR